MAVADPVLDDAILASMNEDRDYVADFVFPLCAPTNITANPGTGEYSFTYYKVDQSNVQGANQHSLEWTPGSSATSIGISMSDATGTARRYAAKVVIPDCEVEGFEARGLTDVDRDLVVNAVTQSLLIDKEVRAYAAITALSTNGITRSGSTLWTDKANSSPLDQMKDAFDSIKTKTNLKAPGLARCKSDFDALAAHPESAGALPSDVYGIVDANALSAILSAKLYGYRVDESDEARPMIEVRIGGASRNSADEGQTASLGYIWSSRSLLFASPEVGGDGYAALRSPGAGRQFEAMPLTSKSYTDDDTEQVFTRVAYASGMEFTDEGASYYFA